MKITGVKVHVLEWDRKPGRWADAYMPHGPKAHETFVRILTDEGMEGHSFNWKGADIEAVKWRIVGRNPLDRERIWQDFWRTNRMLPSALGMESVDVALWDLFGKVSGLPVHKLLGGLRDRIPAYASTLTLETLPEYLALAEDCVARGYRAIKLHAWGRVSDDLELCRELRRTVGDDIHLMYDASGLFGYEDAVRFGRALEELDYYWYEEPIDEFSITALARITRELDVPIVVAETSHGGPSNALDHLMAGAGDIVLTDPLMPFKGGITGSMKTAWICEAFGVMCEVHGSPVPCLHVACAIPSCRYFEQIVPPEGYFFPPGIDVASKYVDSDGCVSPWSEPGLGLRIDWPWVEKHTVRILE